MAVDPTILTQNPIPNQIGVSRDTNIYMIVAGPDGMDPTTFSVELDFGAGYEFAIQAGVFQPYYMGAGSLMSAFSSGGDSGYTVSIDPQFTFPIDTIIGVRINAVHL